MQRDGDEDQKREGKKKGLVTLRQREVASRVAAQLNGKPRLGDGGMVAPLTPCVMRDDTGPSTLACLGLSWTG